MLSSAAATTGCAFTLADCQAAATAAGTTAYAMRTNLPAGGCYAISRSGFGVTGYLYAPDPDNCPSWAVADCRIAWSNYPQPPVHTGQCTYNDGHETSSDEFNWVSQHLNGNGENLDGPRGAASDIYKDWVATCVACSTEPGCTDPLGSNFDENAAVDDGSCIKGCDSDPCVNGACTDEIGGGYTCSCTAGYAGTDCDTDIDECVGVTCPNGECQDLVNGYVCIENVGCTDANYLNYDPSANVNDGSCATIKVEGCTDSNYLNYNALATFNDGSCATIKAEGCTDANYVNYDASANYDDGSCGALIKANFVDNTDCNALKNAAASACGVTKDRVCIKQTVYN